MVKRNISGLLILIALMSVITLQINASSNIYKLDELGLEVSIPSTYNVITQDTPTTSSVFNDSGISGKELIEHFKTNGIYLNAIPNDTSNEEIVVTMTDGLWDNFSVFSDTTIKALASVLISKYEDYGIVVSDFDVYHHSQAKFIKIYLTDSTNSMCGLQFFTIYGAKAMYFTIRSYSGELSQKQEETITNIVDSIKYDTPPVSPPDVPETDAFVYTDADTNTKFTVPANWYEEELSKERQYIDVKFASAKEEGLTIMYGSTDVWEMMTEDEREGITRSDINNSAFTLEDMSEFFTVDKNQISLVKYNGVEYYQATVKSRTELYGLDFTAEMTCAIRFENGWGYWFQFSGTTDNKHFEDFQKLLNTIEYPYYKKEISTSRLKIALVFVVIVVIVIFLFSMIIDRKTRKSEQRAITTTAFDKSCPYCNTSLPYDSEFCHNCGKKLTAMRDGKNNL